MITKDTPAESELCEKKKPWQTHRLQQLQQEASPLVFGKKHQRKDIRNKMTSPAPCQVIFDGDHQTASSRYDFSGTTHRNTFRIVIPLKSDKVSQNQLSLDPFYPPNSEVKTW
jgi:hypothetical protein